MGGAVSSGSNNDELVDNLVLAGYIKTPEIERVFRAVDRAFYFLPKSRETAYKDVAWKSDNIHISAPCIYSEVMENLGLERGLSFLNVGSGTGYLSTMVGLVLGKNGVNHGIEIYQDVVDYAYERLHDFKNTCDGVDIFEFCEPVFTQGNIFNTPPTCQYDRIYCGAACPPNHLTYFSSFLKIQGILIVPYSDELLKLTRESETQFTHESILPVSFAMLQLPSEPQPGQCTLPMIQPHSLQELTRFSIRSIFRNAVEKEIPALGNYYARGTSICRYAHFKRCRRQFLIVNSDRESNESGRNFRTFFLNGLLIGRYVEGNMRLRTGNISPDTERIEVVPDTEEEAGSASHEETPERAEVNDNEMEEHGKSTTSSSDQEEQSPRRRKTPKNKNSTSRGTNGRKFGSVPRIPKRKKVKCVKSEKSNSCDKETPKTSEELPTVPESSEDSDISTHSFFSSASSSSPSSTAASNDDPDSSDSSDLVMPGRSNRATDYTSHDEDEEDVERDEDDDVEFKDLKKAAANPPKVTYRGGLEAKIKLLSLPKPLKLYLNYNREFQN